MNEEVKFSLTWIALKLLGKDLYSHPWSAVSELVANGIDAGANEIYVLLDISNGRDKATIEIFDNGQGMGVADIDDYVKIGYNKRKTNKKYRRPPMGRKGIGKLAALYLSNHYYLLTRAEKNDPLHYELDVTQEPDKNDQPGLKALDVSTITDSRLLQKWRENSSGTLIRIVDIDLTGYAEAAFSGLSSKLANHFLADSQAECKIFFARKENAEDTVEFSEVEKQIAFKNFLLYGEFNITDSNKEKLASEELHLEIKSKTVKKRPIILTEKDYEEIILTDSIKPPGSENYIPYSLSGWVGMHASIRQEIAQKNDPEYRKNNAYSPNKIRLYVRNKLAIDNIIPLLGSTQTYANYLEGEISFDILDDDSFPDIATTSREGFDISDERVQILIGKMKNLVRAFINKRHKLNDEFAREIKDKIARANDKASESIADDTYKNALESLEARFPGEEQKDKRQEAAKEIAKKTGMSSFKHLDDNEVRAKEEYRVFLSHSRKDKALADLLWNILKSRGVEHEEVFYTSRDDTTPDVPKIQAENLEKVIHENITRNNTKMAFVCSDDFRKSEFCLFEAGAAWVTRTQKEWSLLTKKYDDIPEYLRQGGAVVSLVDDSGTLQLNRETYFAVIRVANSLMEHLNKGRQIEGKIELQKFDEKIPDDFELKQSNKNIEDFYDKTVVDAFKHAMTATDEK